MNKTEMGRKEAQEAQKVARVIVARWRVGGLEDLESKLTATN
jgi:hypothetical protein